MIAQHITLRCCLPSGAHKEDDRFKAIVVINFREAAELYLEEFPIKCRERLIIVKGA
jgi:hypothetical protein